jgi:large subunit ribosomal protein L4
MPEKRKKKNPKSKGAKRSPGKSRKAALKKPREISKPGEKNNAAPEIREKSLSIYNLSGKPVETVALDSLFLPNSINRNLIYQVVLMYQANQREGTASTKERGAVRGGGKKPWKQKGTGQARHGSRRSPIWRGGGTTFGPQPRDYSYQLPQQMKRSAVVEGLKEKVSHDKVLLLNELELPTSKTKQMVGVLKTFKLEKPLILVDQKKQNVVLASRNIQGLSLRTASEVNVLDIATHKECVMTKAAYSGLLKRLKG